MVCAWLRTCVCVCVCVCRRKVKTALQELYVMSYICRVCNITNGVIMLYAQRNTRFDHQLYLLT
jgi:hypothetical protein